MILETIKTAITQNIGPLKPAPKQWLKRNCPLCMSRGYTQDTRNRFGIQFNTDSIITNCFNCGFSAVCTEHNRISNSFEFFLRSINIDDQFIKRINFQIFKDYNNISIVREGDTLEKTLEKLRATTSKWTPTKLPKDSKSIFSHLEEGCDDKYLLEVVNYMMSRNIHDLDNFYWTPITQNNLNRRVMIPYYYRSNIVGFTSRLCYKPDKYIPKYYQQCPPDFIYNLDNQQDWDRKYIILCEGVLDAYVTDGIAILGEVTQSKIDIINRLDKEIIVCPDRDKKGSDLVDAALENNWAVTFPKWDNKIKDAADAARKYGRLLTVHSIINSMIDNKSKIKIQWDIDSRERKRRES